MRDDWRAKQPPNPFAVGPRPPSTSSHSASHSASHTVTEEEKEEPKELDTEIGNYSLKDILKLFKLPLEFGEADMRRAKRTTMQTHPDRSGLPPEYFRFFSAAYKMLEQIHEFRSSKKMRENELKKPESALYMNTTYETEVDNEKALLLKDITKRDDFNEWFNEMFQKAQSKDSDRETSTGYEKWLRSEEEDAEEALRQAQVTKQSQMDAYFEERKAKAAAQTLVRHRGVHEFNSMGHSAGQELDRSGTNVEYASGIFDKLQYEDLKRAHTETVIPVSTREELARRPTFDSVEDYTNYRSRQNVMAMTKEETEAHMMRMATRNSELETQRAFNILKQDEMAQRRQEEWWSSIRALKPPSRR